MKNRRITIVAFLLIATLVMGVGYAAITGSLTINGTAAYTPRELVNEATVKFVKATASAGCSATAGDGVSAIMDVSFMDDDNVADTSTKEYSTEAVFDIKYTGDTSLSDVKVVVSTPVTATQNALFTVMHEFVNGDNIVAPGETIQVKVTVKYQVPDPVPTSAITDTFTINLNYEPIV